VRFILRVLQQCKSEGGICRKFPLRLCVLRLSAKKDHMAHPPRGIKPRFRRGVDRFNRNAR